MSYNTEAFEVRGAPMAPAQPVPSVWLFLWFAGSCSPLLEISPSGVGLRVLVAAGRRCVNAPRAPPTCGLRKRSWAGCGPGPAVTYQIVSTKVVMRAMLASLKPGDQGQHHDCPKCPGWIAPSCVRRRSRRPAAAGLHAR